jgi:MtaA/CmuA family methyltransferase
MTPLQRCLTVLAGGTPDRVPVVPQGFLFSIQHAGFSVGAVSRDARKMAEAHRVCQADFGYDGCVIDFDDATLAEACGAKVIMRDEDPAIVDESDVLLKNLADVDKLRLPDPARDGRLPIWLEATRLLRAATRNEVFILGRADQGPFSLACLLRGSQTFLMDLMDEDKAEHVARLIDYCRKACAIFAKAQKDAGAHATSIGDAFAGPSVVSPRIYRRFAQRPEADLVSEVQAYGIPMAVHICGNTNGIIADMGSTGAAILEVDWQLDLAAARKAVPPATVLMGNINPSDMVFKTPDDIAASAAKVIADTGGRGLFLSSGCALGRNTKPDNLRALITAGAEHGFV